MGYCLTAVMHLAQFMIRNAPFLSYIDHKKLKIIIILDITVPKLILTNMKGDCYKKPNKIKALING